MTWSVEPSPLRRELRALNKLLRPKGTRIVAQKKQTSTILSLSPLDIEESEC